MKIWLDESDGKSFFVSVPTMNVDEYLSFDWTTKGHRVVIQRLTASGVKPPQDRQPDAEWDTLVINGGKLVEKQHNVWYDFGQNDLVDGENWQQVKEWPLEISVAERMLKLAHEITEHEDNFESIHKSIKELETLIGHEAHRCGVGLACL